MDKKQSYWYGWIYLLRVTHDKREYYKIGKTSSPERRFAELRRSYGNFEIIDNQETAFTTPIEDLMHEFFADKRYRGGWREELFSLTDEEVVIYKKVLSTLIRMEETIMFVYVPPSLTIIKDPTQKRVAAR